jgi:hypothetical protein
MGPGRAGGRAQRGALASLSQRSSLRTVTAMIHIMAYTAAGRVPVTTRPGRSRSPGRTAAGRAGSFNPEEHRGRTVTFFQPVRSDLIKSSGTLGVFW